MRGDFGDVDTSWTYRSRTDAQLVLNKTHAETALATARKDRTTSARKLHRLSADLNVKKDAVKRAGLTGRVSPLWCAPAPARYDAPPPTPRRPLRHEVHVRRARQGASAHALGRVHLVRATR